MPANSGNEIRVRELPVTPPACVACGLATSDWDRIADKAYCIDCMEAIATGEGAPVIERKERSRCAVCYQRGTVPFLTTPRGAQASLEIDLCGPHLRRVVFRTLGPHAFATLRKSLAELGIDVDDVFLLSSHFYDAHGRAIRPAMGG